MGGFIKRINWKLSLSLALFFGWMLSFSFNGPVLNIFMEYRSYKGIALGLTFTLFHAIGLFLAGFFINNIRIWKKMMLCGVCICVIIYIAVFFMNISYLPFLMALAGLFAGVLVIGWSYPYTEKLCISGRIKFMAVTIFIAGIIYYLLNIISTVLPFYIIYILTGVPLILSLWFIVKLPPDISPISVPTTFESNYPKKLMLLLCLLVIGLSINGGFMYNVMYPSLSAFENIALYFRQIPYLAVLSLIFWRFNVMGNKLLPVYIATSLMGLAFVSFALLSSSVLGYFLTETFIQSSFALLDLFIWTILGDIAQNNSHPFKVFSLGLFANVFAIFAGGVTGNFIMNISSNYHMLTAFFAAAVIFLTFLITPSLNSSIEKDLVSKLNKLLTAESSNEDISIAEQLLEHSVNELPVVNKEPARKIKASDYNIQSLLDVHLTSREKEILSLIFCGNTNRDIASSLCISGNTLKTHLKNLFRKLGVSSKNELLSLALDLHNSASLKKEIN